MEDETGEEETGEETSQNTETSKGTPHPAAPEAPGETSPLWDMSRNGEAYKHPAVGEGILREFIRLSLRK